MTVDTDTQPTTNLAGVWNFVDGEGVNGINKDTSKVAYYPKLTDFNLKLYAIWAESNGAGTQIRVAFAKAE